MCWGLSQFVGRAYLVSGAKEDRHKKKSVTNDQHPSVTRPVAAGYSAYNLLPPWLIHSYHPPPLRP